MNILAREDHNKVHDRRYLRGNVARQSFTEIKIDPVAQSAICNDDFSSRFEDNFEFLNGREKESTLLLADIKRFGKNRVVLDAEEISKYIYVVAKGQISILSDGVNIKTLSPGDMFGESAFLSGSAEGRQFVATDDSDVLMIDLEILNKLVRNNSFFHGRFSDCLTKSLQQKWQG